MFKPSFVRNKLGCEYNALGIFLECFILACLLSLASRSVPHEPETAYVAINATVVWLALLRLRRCTLH